MTTNLGAAHRLVEAAEAANKQLSRIMPQVRELADTLSELEQRSAQGGDDIKSFVAAIRESQVVGDNETDIEELVAMLQVTVTLYEDYVYDAERFNKLLENVNLRASKLHYMHSDAYNKFRQVRDAF